MKDDIRCFQENSYFLVRCADTDRVLAGLFETIESDTKALKEAEYFVEKGFAKNTYIQEIDADGQEVQND